MQVIDQNSVFLQAGIADNCPVVVFWYLKDFIKYLCAVENPIQIIQDGRYFG